MFFKNSSYVIDLHHQSKVNHTSIRNWFSTNPFSIHKELKCTCIFSLKNSVLGPPRLHLVLVMVGGDELYHLLSPPQQYLGQILNLHIAAPMLLVPFFSFLCVFCTNFIQNQQPLPPASLAPWHINQTQMLNSNVNKTNKGTPKVILLQGLKLINGQTFY